METRLLAAPVSAVVIGLVVTLTLGATSASDGVIGASLVAAVFLVAGIAAWSVLRS